MKIPLSRGGSLAILNRVARGVPLVLVSIVAVSILVRLTVRDRFPVLATLYYGLPPVVGAGLLAAAAGCWFLERRRRRAAATLAGVLLLGAWQLGISWFLHDAARGEIRLLVWNTENGSRGWERLLSEAAALDPDVVCLVEAEGTKARLPGAFPSHDWRELPGGLVAGFRGRILETEFIQFGEAARAAVVRGTVGGGPLTVVIVDVWATPLLHRRAAFEPLGELLARVKPDLVCGDFNTPRDSVFFEPWRRDLRHAFEEAGDGLDLTWPMPLPVLSLDHAWSGPRLVPRACCHEGSRASDHRAVVVDYARVRDLPPSMSPSGRRSKPVPVDRGVQDGKRFRDVEHLLAPDELEESAPRS